MANYKEPYSCPVCGNYTFEFEGDIEDCPICGWTNDGITDGGGVNVLSVAEYREKRYKEVS